MRIQDSKSKWSTKLKAKLGLVLALSLALVGVLAITGCGGSDSSDDDNGSTDTETTTSSSGLPDLSGVTISYLGFGGENDDMMTKAWFKPFEKATGAKIITDEPTDYAKLEAQVKSGNVTYDLVDGDAFIMDPGCGTDWEKLDIPNAKYLLPRYEPQSACTAPDYVYSYVIGYSPTAFPDGGPNDCADFFDTEKYPGTRLIWSYYYGNAPECAAVAGGADPKNPYPMDIDSIADQMDRIKDSMRLYDTSGQSDDAMLNNDAQMGIFTSRNMYEAEQLGADWKIADGWSMTTNGTFGVPKGAPNKDAAEALINYILDPENNKRFYDLLPAYGSAQGYEPKAAKSMDPWLVSGSDAILNAGGIVDWAWWAENDAAFADVWTQATTG